jgi:hypothetical protein
MPVPCAPDSVCASATTTAAKATDGDVCGGR